MADRTLPIRIAVLLAALAQPLAATLATFDDASSGAAGAAEPLITPAPYAFAIWGAIVVGSLLYAGYQLLPGRRNPRLYRAVAPYALIAFLGFSAWIYAADRDWLWGTVAVFLVMGFALYRALGRITAASEAGQLSMLEQAIAHGTFGLYAGWATVAVFANAAAAIVFTGIGSSSAIGWQIVILIAATAASIGGIRLARGSIPHAAAIAWAFVGVTLGTLQAGAPAALTVTATAGTLCVGAAWIRMRKQPPLRQFSGNA